MDVWKYNMILIRQNEGTRNKHTSIVIIKQEFDPGEQNEVTSQGINPSNHLEISI
jgi:hypothetical protein